MENHMSSPSNLMAEVMSSDGDVDSDALMSLLPTQPGELAFALGLELDALNSDSPLPRQRLNDFLLTLRLAVPRAGAPRKAFEWFRSKPLPSFGGATAMQLVQAGRASAVGNHLQRIDKGGFT
jgi:hypothetical protein